MATPYPKPAEIQRDWLLVDLADQTVGRAASQISKLLRGKHKPTFMTHADAGDYVVCINAERVKFSGRKLDQKEYHRYTGHIGNLKSVTARELLATKPEEIIKQAVRRMLPRTALGRQTFSKLKVYAGTDHPHAAQRPTPYELPHK